MKCATLIEMLAHRAQGQSDKLFARFIGNGEPSTYTYAEMWDYAGRWAALLRHRRIQPAARVLIALPNSAEFCGAYFGTLMAGGVPAPAAPLSTASRGSTSIRTMIKSIGAEIVIGTDTLTARASELGINAGVLTANGLTDERGFAPPASVKGDDIALLQFTSGTSGSAKAVRLTHEALLAQTRLITNALRLDYRTDSAVSWLPFFHDMGLIGFLLTPAALGGSVTILPTEKFARRPARWMQLISEFGATITGGPPSAYALCGKYSRPEDVSRLDLSGLRIALVGAEPVPRQSLVDFSAAFAPAGFRASVFVPTYGLAESGLAVTISQPNAGPVFDIVERSTLQQSDLAVRSTEADGSPETCAITSAGVAVQETTILIVDATGRSLADRHIGEVVVRSPSLMLGYLGAPARTRQVLRNGWLWTGDLGYLADGHLYLTGRKKELLIAGGRKYQPQALEQVVASLSGVKSGRVVAIGCDDVQQATSRIVILAETALVARAERERLRREIRQNLVCASYPVNDVRLLPPKSIRNTVNGKLRRLDALRRYMAGEFGDE